MSVRVVTGRPQIVPLSSGLAQEIQVAYDADLVRVRFFKAGEDPKASGKIAFELGAEVEGGHAVSANHWTIDQGEVLVFRPMPLNRQPGAPLVSFWVGDGSSATGAEVWASSERG
jgi:hypothetical protein